MRVGYIGLGNAGYSMASNLPKAGYHLVVHDVDEVKVQRAVSEWPNTTAANWEGAFSDCEVIVTMLPHGKIVRDVLLGEGGFARALQPGMMLLES
jgi:3-hydroxyisobutyrate dehydrogenase-like beta-hydroxyacid dehydrogenase